MKLNKFLPLAFAFAAQLGFAQSRFSKADFEHKRDSVDKAIRMKVEQTLTHVRPMTHPIAKSIDSATYADTTHYRRFLLDDPDSRMRHGAFNLNKEVAANKGKKKGFVYEENADHFFLLSMKDAENLIKQTDKMTRDYQLEPMNVYFSLNNEPNAEIDDPATINDDIEDKDPTDKFGVVITSRLSDIADLKMMEEVEYHEGGHRKKYNPGILSNFEEIPENLPEPVKISMIDSMKRSIEYGADYEAETKIGYKKTLNGMAELPATDVPQPGDDAVFSKRLQQAAAFEAGYSNYRDHPTTAQRMYGVMLMQEFKENSALADVYESLMPEQLKFVARKENILKK